MKTHSAFGLGPSSAAGASIEVGFAEEVIYYTTSDGMLSVYSMTVTSIAVPSTFSATYACSKVRL